MFLRLILSSNNIYKFIKTEDNEFIKHLNPKNDSGRYLPPIINIVCSQCGRKYSFHTNLVNNHEINIVSTEGNIQISKDGKFKCDKCDGIN
jgi:hypothetical protein